MSNIINFPLKEIFDRDVFDRSQDNAKKLASECVMNSETLEEYALTLAMASGFALSYMKENHPDAWDTCGDALALISVGNGLSDE